MIKIIANTLIDAFCASMLVGFISLGVAFLTMPFFTIEPLWFCAFSFPFFVIGLAFFMVLDKRG